MMNLLSLSLLISSLAAAGFLSPHPKPNPPSSPPPPVSGDLSSNFKDAASDFSKSPEEKISSAITKPKHKVTQLEDAVKDVSDKANDAGEEIPANISAVTKKSGHRAKATAAKLEENLTYIMRRARDLGRDFVVHVAAGTISAARSSAAVTHLLGFAIAFGTCVWVTFASSHVLASALPRQQFGVVQSRIYPVYFGAVGFSVGAALVAFFIGSGWRSTAERLQGYNLLGVLGMVMFNMLYLEPRATKAMFERMKLEKENGKGRHIMADHSAEPAVMVPPATPIGLARTTNSLETTGQETVKSRMSRASKKLRRLNTYSSFLNLCSLMALCWHLVYLAQHLESNC